nr:reverse transcriptase domain-containing protein [Tanacetum cinerariifolium]
MRTRNSYLPNNSSVTIPRRQNKRRIPNVVEPELRTIVEMADNRTLEELLQAPTKRYGEAIIIPKINADHFEIKMNLLQLVQANPYHGFERENPHAHINNFKRITLTLKFRDVPNDVIKLMMFPYYLKGNAKVWYDKEPPNLILTWEDLVNKFVNQFFPPSKTTHLKNEISRFTQRFEETFGEAWERFKEMLRACPHHGFTELAQIDTFYNGLNDNDQDSLNTTAGGNLLSKTTREALQIIENKEKVRYSRNEPNVSRMNTTSRDNASKSDDRIDKLADQISTLVDIFAKKIVTPAPVKAVEESCVTCGGKKCGAQGLCAAYLRSFSALALSFLLFFFSITVKDKQENDKIRTKPDKNYKLQNIHEELAEYINTPGWNRPPFYDDDDDDDVEYTIAITPVLSTEEPVDSLTKDHFEIVTKTNDDNSSSNDDSLYKENIEYVEASPHDSKVVILEVAEIVIPEDEEIEDDNLREKLLNVHLLIANIEALKDNPTPSSELLTKSSSTSPKSFLEETSTFHNSSPEFENFCFDLEEISSGSTTTHSDISLSDYEVFYFDDDHIKEISSGSTTTHSNVSLFEYNSFTFDLSNDQFPPTDRSDFTHKEFANELAHIISPPEYNCFYFGNLPDPGELISILNSGIRKNSSTTRVNLPVEDDHSPLLAYVVWIFLAYLTYPVIPPYLHSFGNEDTIFDPGITINHFCSFKLGLSHRILGNLKTLAKGFYPQALISSASTGNQ